MDAAKAARDTVLRTVPDVVCLLDRASVGSIAAGTGWKRWKPVSRVVARDHNEFPRLDHTGRKRCALLLSVFLLLAGLPIVSGCHSSAPPLAASTQAIQQAAQSGLSAPEIDEVLKSRVTPPLAWQPQPIKLTDRSRHRVWISPSGSTAYGVIYFDLPLPVGADLALWGFLNQMKATEGEADLLSKTSDPKLPGLRFVASGGLYTVRCNMTVAGFHGWVAYAGILRARPVNSAELKLAELAREQTRFDLR
jgi:hypothetical protein